MTALACPLPNADPLIKSSLVSKNVNIAGHRTSVRLEPAMWAALEEIVRRERATVHAICTAVAQNKSPASSVTAALRVFILQYYRAAATEDGHAKARHGNIFPFAITAQMIAPGRAI